MAEMMNCVNEAVAAAAAAAPARVVSISECDSDDSDSYIGEGVYHNPVTRLEDGRCVVYTEPQDQSEAVLECVRQRRLELEKHLSKPENWTKEEDEDSSSDYDPDEEEEEDDDALVTSEASDDDSPESETEADIDAAREQEFCNRVTNEFFHKQASLDSIYLNELNATEKELYRSNPKRACELHQENLRLTALNAMIEEASKSDNPIIKDFWDTVRELMDDYVPIMLQFRIDEIKRKVRKVTLSD